MRVLFLHTSPSVIIIVITGLLRVWFAALLIIIGCTTFSFSTVPSFERPRCKNPTLENRFSISLTVDKLSKQLESRLWFKNRTDIPSCVRREEIIPRRTRVPFSAFLCFHIDLLLSSASIRIMPGLFSFTEHNGLPHRITKSNIASFAIPGARSGARPNSSDASRTALITLSTMPAMYSRSKPGKAGKLFVMKLLMYASNSGAVSGRYMIFESFLSIFL